MIETYLQRLKQKETGLITRHGGIMRLISPL